MPHAGLGTPRACILSQHSHASLWCLCAGSSCCSGPLQTGDGLQRSSLHSRCHVHSSEMQMCSTSPTQRTEPPIAVTSVVVQRQNVAQDNGAQCMQLAGMGYQQPSMTPVCSHLVVLTGSSPLPGLHPLNSFLSFPHSLYSSFGGSFYWLFILFQCLP